MPDQLEQGTSQFAGDQKLPAVDIIFDPARLLPFLRESVVPLLLPGVELRDAVVETMEYHPERRCFVSCRLTFADGGEQVILISAAKDERLGRTYEGSFASNDPPRWLFFEEQAALIEVFPTDFRLPAMPSLLDPARARDLFADVEGLPDEAPIVEVIAYRPHTSCIVGYTFAGAEGGPRRFVAKIGGGSTMGERHLEVSIALNQRLAGSPVVLPKAYRVRGAGGVALMDFVPGLALHEAFAKAGEAERQGLIRRAVEAVFALHSIDANDLLRKRSDLAERLEYTRSRSKRIELAFPAVAERIAVLMRRFEELIAAEPPQTGRHTFLHGDLKLSQLIVHEGQMAVIDLEGACYGDPAIDLGNLLADMRREGMRFEEDWRPYTGATLGVYAELAGDASIVRRARVAEACAVLRMAVRSVRHDSLLPQTGDGWVPDMLLREAEACIDSL